MSEQKKITFKGKTYTYNVPTQLFRKLKPALTFQETRQLIKDYEENKMVRTHKKKIPEETILTMQDQQFIYCLMIEQIHKTQ